MSTHIEANKNEMSNIVIMPGDPLRAKYIVDNYLEDVNVISRIRGNNIYTGVYRGIRISIVPSGMGMNSAGIYIYELFNEYDVDYIIRIGTMGSYVEDLKVKDVFLVETSYSDSNILALYNGEENHECKASVSLNEIISATAGEVDIALQKGLVHCSPLFYRKDKSYLDKVKEKGCLGVEMESYVLFFMAEHFGKDAATILTVSDSFVSEEKLSSLERERNLDKMIKLALNSSLKIN